MSLPSSLFELRLSVYHGLRLLFSDFRLALGGGIVFRAVLARAAVRDVSGAPLDRSARLGFPLVHPCKSGRAQPGGMAKPRFRHVRAKRFLLRFATTRRHMIQQSR